MIPSLDLINLLEQFTVLRNPVYLLDYLFISHVAQEQPEGRDA